ncbi:hypothetical protein J6590_002743 [Homalodisca vitripennis]|nr:hypothetical protein J6590_002743 [Homalodisca vitripennis]
MQYVSNDLKAESYRLSTSRSVIFHKDTQEWASTVPAYLREPPGYPHRAVWSGYKLCYPNGSPRGPQDIDPSHFINSV